MIRIPSQRRHPRIPCRRKARVEFAVWSLHDDAPWVEVDGAIQNVSRGGLALAAEIPPDTRALLGGRAGIRPGMPLTVRFRAGSRTFTLPGCIAWANVDSPRAILGVELRLQRASKATRRAFESWALREEKERGLETQDPDPARDALVERLCVLVDALEGVIDRLSRGHVEPAQASRVDELAVHLQAACTVLELVRLRERLKH